MLRKITDRLMLSIISRWKLAAVIMTAALGSFAASAQDRPYFVDGFHGGVYGHYPMQTYTKFMADQLEAHPLWSFCLEIEPETWDTVAVKTPADYQRFKKLVESPRIEFTNPSYAQPYLYNISGESIIRQFQYGMRKVNCHFPSARFLTYSAEEPCFTSCLPQILGQLGFKYASLKCPDTCWGGYMAPFGNGLVNWIGPDGSSLVTVPRYACEDLQKGTVWQTTAWGNSDEYLQACEKAGIENPVGMCFQDAGWTYGPWIGYGDSVRNNSIYVTWRDYFERITPEAEKEDYHLSQQDVKPGLMWGSQVLQTIAREVRHTENNLTMTEKAGAIAHLAGGSLFDQSLMDEAWRTLMLSQHHDSWIVPYNNLNKRGTWADNIKLWTSSADENCSLIMNSIADSFGDDYSGESYRVLVFNTSGHQRSSIVSSDLPERFAGRNLLLTDSEGKCVKYELKDGAVSFKAETKPFSITTYTVATGKRSNKIEPVVKEYSKKDGLVKMRSGLYEMTLDPSKGGVIVSLKSSDGFEYVDSGSERGMNELRGWFYDEDKWLSSMDAPASVTVTSVKGQKTVARIEGTIASSPFVQTITLEEGEDRIGMTLRIDWRHNEGIGKFRQTDAGGANHRAFYDDRYKLSVSFPLALDNPSLFKDAPFDVCDKMEDDTFYDKWDSIKNNVILNWIDIESSNGRSAALFSDHTTSYSYGPDHPLSLTVQFSGSGLWGRDYPITRPTEINYALTPHEGTWESAGIQDETEEWNEPLYVMNVGAGDPVSKSFLSTEGTGYVVSAFYPCDGGYTLRLYNASGDDSEKNIKLSFPVERISAVDLQGCETGTVSALEDGSFPISAPRFGVRTFQLQTN